jgi:hypothetical protein
MNDTNLETPRVGGRPRRLHPRHRINLADGEFLQARSELAKELGVSVRTIARMNLPTTHVGGVAYHPHFESLDPYRIAHCAAQGGARAAQVAGGRCDVSGTKKNTRPLNVIAGEINRIDRDRI